MYVIAGVSGKTGSVVASSLLQQKKPVRVIVRSEEKGRAWKTRGAEVAVASLDDAAAFERALTGAEGLYYLLPPDLKSEDPIGRARRFIDVLHGVLSRSKVPHLTYLSSIGAQHETGTGPIRTHHYGEQKLRPLASRITFVRAAYFMENTAAMVPVIKGQGVLPVFVPTDRKFPMVATRDIGEVAAHSLLDPPGATQVLELSGPTDYSFDEAAQAYSRGLGKPVNAVQVPEPGIVPALQQTGFSTAMAELFREMATGMQRGHVSFEGGAARPVRGKVTFDAFVKQLLGG